MPYQIPPDVESRVTALLADGYASVDDVLRDALSALEYRREEIAAIREGIEDVEAGRYRPLEEVDAEIRKKHNFPQVN